ncbi:[acyl-carrier-protein] S-malonyltransferase [Paenibacillus sp. CF095]|uniref:ACP S-malonyltransferase n=1 Tax=Paenibacillus sp. CF095 TaxID=1881033 RepID=UPI000882C503|nr:ACP S-malonyltransferase [Paenibacillus sp. CF095]SDD50773.1 [acyl-carrier-protein] S-malonyltransferase [Paenibacillus sp. CF095]
MRKIALVFPGQGSQYSGMGKFLYENYPIAKKTFEEANIALGYDLTSLCFEGPDTELQKTEFTQPAILTCSIAAYRVYMQEFNISPHFMAGHSLGEITALTASGAIPFSAAVQIVSKRGHFMQEAAAVGIGTMSAVSRINPFDVERICNEVSTEKQFVTISNYNTPDQTVIAGHVGGVEAAERKLVELGADIIRLKVSAPFHCSLMNTAAFNLEQELMKMEYSDPEIPVIANHNALPYIGGSRIVQALTTQMTEPIKWNDTMQFLKNQGINIVVEVGPGTVLRNMMKRTLSDIQSFSFDKEEDWRELKNLLSSGQLVHPCFISRCLAIAVCTRNRNWNQDEYQRGVIEPYRRIQTMLAEIEQIEQTPTLEQKQAALDMLRLVFETKMTSIEEQQERFEQLFEETNSRDQFPDFQVNTLKQMIT